ncbi:MAG: DUF4386 family protein [Cyclobacteriaceae bacterium]
MKSETRLTKWTGILLLIFTLISPVHYTLIDAHLQIDLGMNSITAFINENKQLFLFGIGLDLIIFLIIPAIVSYMHSLTRKVNLELSRFALLLTIISASVAIGNELTSNFAMSLAGEQPHILGLDPEQRTALMGLFLDIRSKAYIIVMISWSGALAIYFYLLNQKGFGLLPLLGSLFFILMGLACFLSVIFPGHQTKLAVMITSSIVMIYQIAASIWLIRWRPEV